MCARALQPKQRLQSTCEGIKERQTGSERPLPTLPKPTIAREKFRDALGVDKAQRVFLGLCLPVRLSKNRMASL